ncbi:MAG: cytochrome c, partial [Chloroflexales bacterium]|nr:cytochrome c [Chloroflexales bacterium]
MLRRIGRLLTIGAGALVTLALVAIVSVYGLSESRLRATYPTDIAVPAIPSDAASIERGRLLASAGTHCTGCHGANLGGHTVIDVPPILLVAPNLTSGAGGIATRYSDADWARAIGHGVRPDGTPLQIMPSQNFQQLSDADLGAIIAYV